MASESFEFQDCGYMSLSCIDVASSDAQKAQVVEVILKHIRRAVVHMVNPGAQSSSSGVTRPDQVG